MPVRPFRTIRLIIMIAVAGCSAPTTTAYVQPCMVQITPSGLMTVITGTHVSFTSSVSGNCPSDQRVQWSTSVDSVASIDSTGGFFARARGAVVVTLSLRQDATVKSTNQVNVLNPLIAVPSFARRNER